MIGLPTSTRLHDYLFQSVYLAVRNLDSGVNTDLETQ